jgi:hypothetical protein
MAPPNELGIQKCRAVPALYSGMMSAVGNLQIVLNFDG